MTNDKTRRNAEFPISKQPPAGHAGLGVSGLCFLSSFGIRHSDLDLLWSLGFGHRSFSARQTFSTWSFPSNPAGLNKRIKISTAKAMASRYVDHDVPATNVSTTPMTIPPRAAPG